MNSPREHPADSVGVLIPGPSNMVGVLISDHRLTSKDRGGWSRRPSCPPPVNLKTRVVSTSCRIKKNGGPADKHGCPEICFSSKVHEMRFLTILLALITLFNVPPAEADKLLFKGDAAGMAVALQAPKGAPSLRTAAISGKKATTPSKGKFLVSILKDSRIWGPLVLGIKDGKKIYSVAQARKKKICRKTTARALTGLKASKRSLKVVLKDADGMAYLDSIPPGNSFDAGILAKVDSSCVPTGAKHRLGMPTALAKARAKALAEDCSGMTSNDKDNDSIPDNFDADNNNNGTLDNDDSQCNDMQGTGGGENSFWMFSNFHLDFQNSLNLSMPGINITKEMVDDRLRTYNGLAIQVVGGGQSPVELDCGSLSYCGAGGTGTVSDGPGGNGGTPFPGTPGGAYDPDSDGKGSIQPGPTRDFQLKTNASSDEIKAGDVLIEEVTADGKTTQFAGMLNFAFFTTPALKEISIAGGDTYTISYPVSPGDPGTEGNCFKVPATGDVAATLTMWRPQRKGNAASGEAEYVDMGNLRWQTNIPNAPEIPPIPGQPVSEPSQGPGVCSGNELTYPAIDASFTRENDGLKDHLGDVASSPGNTFSFTINYTECLKAANNFSHADIAWAPGQTLRVPLQMTNQYGDTAVQSICFTRENAPA